MPAESQAIKLNKSTVHYPTASTEKAVFQHLHFITICIVYSLSLFFSVDSKGT